MASMQFAHQKEGVRGRVPGGFQRRSLWPPEALSRAEQIGQQRDDPVPPRRTPFPGRNTRAARRSSPTLARTRARTPARITALPIRRFALYGIVPKTAPFSRNDPLCGRHPAKTVIWREIRQPGPARRTRRRRYGARSSHPRTPRQAQGSRRAGFFPLCHEKGLPRAMPHRATVPFSV